MTPEEIQEMYKLLEAIQTVERFCRDNVSDAVTFNYENRAGVIQTQLKYHVLDGLNRLRKSLKENEND